MQTSVGLRAHLFPGDGSYFAAIDLPNAPLDFFCPCGLDACIAITFEAIEKHARKFGALGLGKTGCLAEEFFDIP